jgi:hypothetical protein
MLRSWFNTIFLIMHVFNSHLYCCVIVYFQLRGVLKNNHLKKQSFYCVDKSCYSWQLPPEVKFLLSMKVYFLGHQIGWS